MNTSKDSILVLWDGDCGFCQRCLEWLKRQHLKGAVTYLSFHEPEAATWVQTIGKENLQQSMYVVTPEDKTYSKADGFRVLLSLSSKWKWLSLLMGLPLIRQLCNLGYTFIANNRFLFGKHSCKLK